MSFQKQASILVWEVRVGAGGRAGRRNSALLVIKLQVHPIVDFIVPQRHVVLKNRVPLLQYDLVPMGASLGCDQLPKVPDGVIVLHLTLAFFTRRSLQTTSIILAASTQGGDWEATESGLQGSPQIAWKKQTPQPPRTAAEITQFKMGKGYE